MNYLTYGEFKSIVSNMINTAVANAMFPEQFWVEMLNEALSFIYSFHNWSWNTITEEFDLNNETGIQLKYPVQEMIECSVVYSSGNTSELQQGQYFADNNVYVVDYDKLKFSTPMTGHFRVVYRRWFIPYKVTDVDRIIDVPYWFNYPLMSLVQFNVLPIWLGEGSGNLMNNWLSNAINVLNILKQKDSYMEADRTLYPKRR